MSSSASPLRFVWPLPVLVGIGAGLAAGVALGRLPAGIVVGVGSAIAVAVLRYATRRPQTPQRIAVDPFTINDPWRRMVQQAISSQNRFDKQLAGQPDGPVRDYLDRVANELNDAVADVWHIAQSGNRLDKTIRELDPSRLQSKMQRLQTADEGNNDPNIDDAIDSMAAQLDAVERIQAESANTESRLRLEITRLDEVVASAALVTSGTLSQQHHDADVRSVVDSLHALQAATNELPGS